MIRQSIDPACGEILVGDLTPVRDFTFVTDTAAAFLAIGRADGVEYGVAYNGGTGVGVSIGDAMSTILNVTGCNKPVVQDRDRQRPQKSEVFALIADNSKLQRATGWRPGVALREGVEATVGWWQPRLASGKVRQGARFLI